MILLMFMVVILAVDLGLLLNYEASTFSTEKACAEFIKSEPFVAELKDLAEGLGGGEFKVKCTLAGEDI